MPENSKKKRKKRRPGILANIRKIMGLNVGTIMFGVLFLYMLFSTVLYMTSGHIESYQVNSGPLSRNETYTGLAIREESVCKADSSGYITYYAREGSKINAYGAVYGLSNDKVQKDTVSLNAKQLSKIRSDMMSFSKGFNASKFNSTYSFKYDLEGNILQYAESGEGTITGTVSRSQSDGIILYSRDNYEGKTLDTVTAQDFDQNSYHETDLKTDGTIKAGDDVYTIITDERWTLLIPLSEKQAAKLQERSTIRVKFLKDDMTQTGDFSIITIDGGKYGRIDFNKGLIRYASDRFLDIELVTNTVTGLKIPLTSIVTKDFYVIPSSVSTKDEKEETGFRVLTTTKDGDSTTIFKVVPIYASVEIEPASSIEETQTGNQTKKNIYYVDKKSFQEGDVIINPETGETYEIGETDSLEGTYCINKGYAVFRRIEILDENEEYAVVAKGTSYGLSRYDHIVKNASKIKEEDILY